MDWFPQVLGTTLTETPLLTTGALAERAALAQVMAPSWTQVISP